MINYNNKSTLSNIDLHKLVARIHNEKIQKIQQLREIYDLSPNTEHHDQSYPSLNAEYITQSDSSLRLSEKDIFDIAKQAQDKELTANVLGLVNINKISDYGISCLLFDQNSQLKVNANHILKIISKYKLEISATICTRLLTSISDKQLIAKLLGQDNLNKLSHHNVYDLLLNAPDIKLMANILGQDNLNKLLPNNVYDLIGCSKDKECTIKILGEKNIKKLSSNNFRDLLQHAFDKQHMATSIGIININKLSAKSVFKLLEREQNKQLMASILGQDNLNKLSHHNVYDLLLNAPDIKLMANILGQDNLSKLSTNNIHDLLSKRNQKDIKKITEIIVKYKK
jgi:hypothetical protein